MKITETINTTNMFNDIIYTGALVSITLFIERLQWLKTHFQTQGYEDICISLDAGYNNISASLTGTRKETAKERTKKRDSAKKRKQTIKEKEISQLQKLMRKYGQPK